jgi:hypothetical protein
VPARTAAGHRLAGLASTSRVKDKVDRTILAARGHPVFATATRIFLASARVSKRTDTAQLAHDRSRDPDAVRPDYWLATKNVSVVSAPRERFATIRDGQTGRPPHDFNGGLDG